MTKLFKAVSLLAVLSLVLVAWRLRRPSTQATRDHCARGDCAADRRLATKLPQRRTQLLCTPNKLV